MRNPPKRKRSEQDDLANTPKRRSPGSNIVIKEDPESDGDNVSNSNAGSSSVSNSSHNDATAENGSSSDPDMDNINDSVGSVSIVDPKIKIASKDIVKEDASLDAALIGNGTTPATDVAPTTGPLSHPTIWKSFQYFRQAFPHNPEIFYYPFTHHNLGGFRAIIQSMAAQHPGLRRPTLREFGTVVSHLMRPRDSAESNVPVPYMYEALSASKVDGQDKWEPDCFNNDTHFVLQDYLAALLGIWGSNATIKLNLTLAIWTNGVPWAYKVWDRHDFQETKVVWIYHDGNHSYAGLGPLGSGRIPSIKAMTTNDFSDKDVESYQRLVNGFGSYTAQHSFSNRPAEQPIPVAKPVTAEQPLPTAQSTHIEQSASAEQPGTGEEPNPAAEPTTAVPSAPVTQSTTVEEPVAVEQPVTAEEDLVTAEESITAEEPAPDAQSTTVEVSTTAEQSAPAVQSVAQQQTGTGEDLVTAEKELVATEEPIAAEEPAPATQSTTVEPPATTEELVDTEETIAAEETASAEKPSQTEDSAPAGLQTPPPYPAAELRTPSMSPLSDCTGGT